MTIQQQIEALKKDFENKIAKLEKQLAEEQKPSKVWKPKEKDRYWFVADYGLEWDDWLCLDEDEYRYKAGNVFETQEEAKWEAEHRIVTTELKHFVAENDPRPITDEDWENEDVYKCYLEFNYKSKMIETNYAIVYKCANQVYASSIEVLQKAIEHIGEDRLKKYYFGVKE